MLTLGSSTRTIFHGWPAAWKVGLATAGIFGIQLLQNPLAAGLAAVAVAGAFLAGGRLFLLEGVQMLRPLWVFVAVVLIWHCAVGDMRGGVVIGLRIIAAVGLANLVTMTTALNDLMAVALWLLAPLRWFGVDPAPAGFAMALCVRFTPALLARAQALFEAWRARSASRVGWPVILPLAASAIDDAEHVAEALRARGGMGRAE